MVEVGILDDDGLTTRKLTQAAIDYCKSTTAEAAALHRSSWIVPCVVLKCATPTNASSSSSVLRLRKHFAISSESLLTERSAEVDRLRHNSNQRGRYANAKMVPCGRSRGES